MRRPPFSPPHARHVSAGYSPRHRHPQKPKEEKEQPLWGRLGQHLKLRFSEHFASSLLSLTLFIGGILLFTHFFSIQYLPSVDLKSATSMLLGVAMTGILTLASLAVLLGVPGLLIQQCVRFKILNPGTESLKKQENSKKPSARKGKGRLSYMLYIYASIFIALCLLILPYYFGLTESFFGWPLALVIVGICVIYFVGVGALAYTYRNGGNPKCLARVRLRKTKRGVHGIWVLGFLTLFQIPVSAFLLLVFPFFKQESDLISIINFGFAISLSCALGIALIHNWKSAALSLGLILLFLVPPFNGLAQISNAAVRTLKLGNLDDTTLLVSPAGCQIISTALQCGQCSLQSTAKDRPFRITGLKILSRIGDEHLLAFGKDKAATRFLLRSSEVIGIVFPAQIKEAPPSVTEAPINCVEIEAISTPIVTSAKASK